LSEKLSSRESQLAKQAADFNAVQVEPDTRRKLDLMRNGLILPSPADPDKSQRLATITSNLGGIYGSGKYCRSENDCMGLTEMSGIMANERDPALLLEMWQGWRDVAPPDESPLPRASNLSKSGRSGLRLCRY
jgi:peptidyl-dipeptidase A